MEVLLEEFGKVVHEEAVDGAAPDELGALGHHAEVVFFEFDDAHRRVGVAHDEEHDVGRRVRRQGQAREPPLVRDWARAAQREPGRYKPSESWWERSTADTRNRSHGGGHRLAAMSDIRRSTWSPPICAASRTAWRCEFVKQPGICVPRKRGERPANRKALETFANGQYRPR